MYAVTTIAPQDGEEAELEEREEAPEEAGRRNAKARQEARDEGRRRPHSSSPSPLITLTPSPSLLIHPAGPVAESPAARNDTDYSAYIAGEAPPQDTFIAVETARALDAQARAQVTLPWIPVTLDWPVAPCHPVSIR